MITGIYQSAAGLEALGRMQETIANNLANVSTDGFKQERLTLQQMPGKATLEINGRLDMKPGGMQMTSQPTHLALASAGFFKISAPEGMFYTRNGNFHLDHEGRLVTLEGYAVQGQKGDIFLSAPEWTVNPAGEILQQGAVVDQLQILSGDTPMQRLGNGFLRPENEESANLADAGRIQVLQGALEASNVNVVESMVDMMAVVRLYEANQKAMEAQDEAVKQAVGQVGRPA